MDRPDHTIALTLWPSLFRPSEGRPLELTWIAFVARFAAPLKRESNSDVPGFALATFDGGRRCNAGARDIEGACFDVDRGATLDQVAALLESWGLAALLYTSFSHRDDAHRFHVVIPYARTVGRDEHATIWRALAARFAAAAIVVDHTPDPARCWRVPVRRRGASYAHRVIDGAELDVDRTLRASTGEGTPLITSPTTIDRIELSTACLPRSSEPTESCARDVSRSGEDFRNAMRMLRAGHSDVEIAAALLASGHVEGRSFEAKADYARRTITAARSMIQESTDTCTIERAVLAQECARDGRPALWRIVLDLISADGEIMRARVTVPAGKYDRETVRRTWDAVIGDAIDPALLVARNGWQLATKLEGTRLLVARKNGAIVWLRAELQNAELQKETGT